MRFIYHLVPNTCSNAIRAGVAGNCDVQVRVIVDEKQVRRQDFFYFDECFLAFSCPFPVLVFFSEVSLTGAHKLCILGINTW